MKPSPFDSFEAFSKAEGAIFTFAHMPMVNMILCGLVAVIGIAFLAKSFFIKH